jgi:DNA-binding NarL/FixJ family response regulator
LSHFAVIRIPIQIELHPGKGKSMAMVDSRKIKILMVVKNNMLRDGLYTLLTAVFPHAEIDEVDREPAVLQEVASKDFDLVIYYPGQTVVDLLPTARKVKQACPALPALLIIEERSQSQAAAAVGIDQVMLSGFSIGELTGVIHRLVREPEG